MYSEYRWVYAIPLCFALTRASGERPDPVTEFQRGAYSSAFQLFSGLATDCDAQAQNYLGIMYYLGYGTARDAQKALEWFRQSANRGNAAAQRNLGMFYGQGLGVKQSFFKAYVWLLLAQQQGNAMATVALTAMSDKLTANQIMRARNAAARLARSIAPTAQPLYRNDSCVASGR